MALMAEGQRAGAQDYLGRVHRFGGDALITDPQAAGLLALWLLTTGERAEALPWLQMAAAADDPECLMQLGLMHLTHELTDASEDEGAKLLHRSAELGNGEAAYNLGVYYEHVAPGFLAKTDWRWLAFGESRAGGAYRDEAIRWYKFAADQGHRLAEQALERLTGSAIGAEA